MNFVGKFDAKLPVDGPIAHPAMHAHVDGASAHAPSDAIIVPDAQLLFGGEFKRSGVDLVLSDDHHELVLHDYFKGEKRVALASPDGAHLTGDLVNALAGHVEVAQADGAAAAAVVVGHVTKLTGTATAIRNGVSIILNQGENIDKGDVLQSGADSTLGVTFIDGTVFGLSSNARMVVNEMIYDPNGSNNSSLLSLVAGTISFVAGETAKHGDMKVDTPVATMGIRGTAVLVEIDFDVPGQNGAPSANFQVLVEPDGTTGSYILFDKNTLAPLATVNTAGTLTKISQGIVSFEAGSPLTSDQQKLITDLFTTKFGDSNTKSLFDHFTDSIVPQSLQPIYLPGPVTLTPIVLIATNSLGQSSSAPSGPQSGPHHTPGAPHVTIFDQSFGEAPGVSDSPTLHTLSAPITFTDPNSGDRPTVAVDFTSFSYQDAHGHDITTSLTPQEKAAIAAVEGISLQTVPGNTNNGSAVWTYSFPDSAFDFLGAGETLTLTYTASVNDNYVSSPETGTATFTITITGTNDVPVITSSAPQTIAFTGGTSVPGGDLTAHVPTSGTISFDDPDLTDTHTVSVKLLLNGLDLPPTPLEIFEHALTASIATDSTGTGFGTINWKLADLPVYLADFIPKGETITLTYAVTVTDSQGATSTQDITVTITGSDTPAVVWIATTTTGSPPGGLWSDALNWETGTVPIATDDVIIITNQLIGLTPSYPVTIDANTHAVAKSVTMNDFGTSPPELINLGSLAVSGAFDMSADSILHNSGTISVGGLMEVLNTSVLLNSGTLTLEDGGDFAAASTITNTNTIDLSGGTLTVETDIANAGGILDVDGAGTLTLDGGGIDGGTINNSGNIDVSGSGAISNAHLNNGHVTIGSNSTLTLDNDTVTGTSFTDTAAGAVIKIDDGTTLTLSGVTINGGTINDGTAGGTGSIHITGDSTISGASLNNGSVTLGSAKLTLDNDTVTGTSFSESSSGSVISVDAGDWLVLAGIAAITGVSGSSIANAGQIEITGTTTLTTDKLINTSAGVVQVDSTDTLTLNGTEIIGGTITDNGIIHVTGASKIDGNAVLDNGTVTADALLTLDNVTVSGTTINDNAGIELYETVKLNGGASIQGTSSAALGAITNNGTLEVAGPATLLDDTLTNTGAVIQIDSTDTLTLNGIEIIGGTITDSGIIHVTGASKIDGNAALNGGTVTADAVLTLDNVTVSGTTINDHSGIELDGTVKLGGGASIQGASSAMLGAITNNGTLEVAGLVTLLNDTLTNSGAVVQVDSTDTLTLDGTEIIGGTITDNGFIHVTGASKIDGNATLDNGTVTVDALLTLDNVTVSGTTINDNSGIELDDTVKLSGGASIQGTSSATPGVITNNGTLEVAGLVTLLNDTLTNTSASGSIIQIDSNDTLALSGTEIIGGIVNDNGTIHVTGASKIDGNATLDNGTVTVDAVLTLDDVTVSGTTINDNFGIELYETVQLNGGASIQGASSAALGAITNNGTLEVAGSATLLDDTLTNTSAGVIQVDDGQTLTLHGTDIAGGTINDGSADGTGSIDITGDSAISNADLNHGSVTLGGVTLTLDNDTVTGTSFNDTASSSVIQVGDGTTLTLSGVHITGGAINDGTADGDGGNINVTTDSTFSDTSLNYGHVTIDGGAKLTLDDGATISSGTLTIDQSGVLDVVHGTAGAAVTLDGSINNAGLLEATGGGTLHIDGNVSNSGTIEANGGTVVVGADASISGTATVTITNGGLADFVGSSTQTLDLNATFSGTGISGTLELDNSQHYGGTVSGFVAGDKIDLTDLTYSSSETDVWNSTTHTLTITEGTHSSNIIFSGSYDQNSFALTDDGNGHTEVVFSPAQASVSGLDHAGNAVEGFALNATLTDLNASGVSYQWLDNGTAIAEATGSNYLPTAADLGKTLDVVVGFTDGSAEHVTALAGTVVAPPAVAINADDTTINENASLTLNTLHASFADAGSDSFTVTLDVIHGTLALDSMVGVSESGSGASLSLTGTLAAIDTALDSGLVYTPTTGYYGSDTLTFEANDGAFGSNTATAAITVAPLPPVFHSMTLTVAQGATDVLTNADFSVTDPNSSSFLYTVGNVTGGQFEVFNGENWVVAQTGGFTTAQIAAGQVEFVQDGSATPPNFSITAADSTTTTVSAPIAPTVNFNDGPTITTANVAQVAESLWGGEGEHQGAAITYADGHLYLSYNNGPETEGTSDTASIFGFNAEPGGLSGSTFSYSWNAGDFFGLAADGNEIYAVGESYPGDGLTTDNVGGIETKSILVRFDTNGAVAEPLGDTAHTFYSYSGVESFQNAIVGTQGDIYAFGSGQPASYSGYIIGEYNSSGTLLATATDPGSLPGGSSANGAVDWEGAIWAVGSSQHGSEAYGSPTVWTFSYNLGSVSIHEDNIGGAGVFNGVTTIGGHLYAAGTAYVDGGQDYLIAEYNTDGSVAWSDKFGDADAISTLNGIVEINGRLFVAGSETSGGVTEGVLMEINASNGAVISTTTYEPGQYNAFTSIATDGQHLFVGGVSGSSVSQDQAVVVTYDVGGSSMTTVEDTAVSIGSIAVSAAAAGSAQIEVTLAVGHGSLVLESGSGLDSIVGAGTGSIELFGSQAAINAALSHGLIYDPAANYTGSDTLMITVNDQGHNATGGALSTTQEVGIAVTPADSIGDGATYTVGAPSGDTIAFASGHGTLDLVQPSSFTGEIAGISGSGDVLDLGGFAANDVVHASSGSYNSATNTTLLVVTDTTADHSVTLTLAGDYSTSTWTVTGDGHGGVNVVDPPAPAAAAIASGSSLEISTAASTENITFQGSTGSLTLDHPANFTGVISGFTGDGTLAGSDHIDLKGIDYHSHSFTESYDATTDTLSVSDGANSAALHFNGVYQAANFSFTTDGAGGTIVYDPPVTDHSAAKTQAVTATNHGFVFNFADLGHGANGAHPVGDTHIFDGQTFVNAEADPSKHHDDGHGHTAFASDGPDTATIAAIKAQLHHDFHFA